MRKRTGSSEGDVNADRWRFTRQPRAAEHEDVERVVINAVRECRALLTNARSGKLGPSARGGSGLRVIPPQNHQDSQ
ncbi:MAG: hypothetical protein AMXMBFR82_16460 [Candidatus Hydrogenedentota bacterium]